MRSVRALASSARPRNGAAEARRRIDLAVSERTPLSRRSTDRWRETSRREAGLPASNEWAIEIESATLDTLIARFGVRHSLKIGVEGFVCACCGPQQALPDAVVRVSAHGAPRLRACLGALLDLGRIVSFSASASRID
jgi:hypothetical protein